MQRKSNLDLVSKSLSCQNAFTPISQKFAEKGLNSNNNELIAMTIAYNSSLVLKQQTCMPNNNNTNIEILVFC
jgi:hypothetical protein